MNYPFINHKIFDSYLHLVSPCDVVDVNRFNMKSLIFTVGVTGDDLRQ